MTGTRAADSELHCGDLGVVGLGLKARAGARNAT